MSIALVKKALAIIDGRMSRVNETSSSVQLSDGSKVNRKELNKRITVLSEFIQHGVNIDEEVLALMAIVDKKKEKRKVQLMEENKHLDRLLEQAKDPETPCKPYIPAAEKVEQVLDKVRMHHPTGSNKRFICGWDYTNEDSPEFLMIFWNNYEQVGNSHGELEQYYRKHHNPRFEAVSGGFFINNTHNNSIGFGNPEPANVYLFGKSSTFRSFIHEIPEIVAYGRQINVNFIFGKTEFGVGEYNDIIAEGFIKPDDKEIKVVGHLDKMLEANKELYEQVLDAPGFAYHFNEITKLAKC